MLNENTESCGSQSQNDDTKSNDFEVCLAMAEGAGERGELALAMHLFLAAFEQASAASSNVDPRAVEGLRSAWDIACQTKQRSMAEHIFEKLDPFLDTAESMSCAETLQQLAMEKLEEFGLSKNDIEEMAEAFSHDLFGIVAPDGGHAAASRVPGVFSPQAMLGASKAPNAGEGAKGKPETGKHAEEQASDRITYEDIHGYRNVIQTMQSFGLGVRKDQRYEEFVKMLNARHGIDRASAVATFLFVSPAREDANQFMAATMGELGLPAIRMTMEEGPQGLPVLCVMASSDHAPRLGFGRPVFDGPGVLMLEDIDLWAAPLVEGADEGEGDLLSRLSKGAREAVNVIYQAVRNPDIQVMATASREEDIDDFFYDLLEPAQVISVPLPTMQERIDVWSGVEKVHPSIRGLDMVELVRLSANMARYDICMAAQEAVEEAYKESLARGTFVPVSRENIFDKLAAYQPLDSMEYRQLEDAVIDEFRNDLDSVDDLLKGGC